MLYLLQSLVAIRRPMAAAEGKLRSFCSKENYITFMEFLHFLCALVVCLRSFPSRVALPWMWRILCFQFYLILQTLCCRWRWRMTYYCIWLLGLCGNKEEWMGREVWWLDRAVVVRWFSALLHYRYHNHWLAASDCCTLFIGGARIGLEGNHW